MQGVDYSKKYELPKQCGNHAEIFPRNIFSVIAGATGCGKNKSDDEFVTRKTKNRLLGCVY